MKALIVLFLATCFSGSALAACPSAIPPTSDPATLGTSLETQTSDHADITGGCIDGVVLGSRAPVVLGSYTIASTLPACTAGLSGALVYVTDAADTPVYNATATGGGSVKTPVFCNGSNWVNH